MPWASYMQRICLFQGTFAEFGRDNGIGRRQRWREGAHVLCFGLCANRTAIVGVEIELAFADREEGHLEVRLQRLLVSVKHVSVARVAVREPAEVDPTAGDLGWLGRRSCVS